MKTTYHSFLLEWLRPPPDVHMCNFQNMGPQTAFMQAVFQTSRTYDRDRLLGVAAARHTWHQPWEQDGSAASAIHCPSHLKKLQRGGDIDCRCRCGERHENLFLLHITHSTNTLPDLLYCLSTPSDHPQSLSRKHNQ